MVADTLAGMGFRRVLSVLGSLLLLVLSTGCLRFDMALVVSPENTLTGEVVVAVDAQLLDHPAFAGSEPPPTDDFFPDVEEGLISSEPFDDGEWVGTKYVLTDVPLDTLDEGVTGEDTTAFELRRVDDYFVLQGALDFEIAANELEGLPVGVLTSGLELRLSITFPGPVLQSNGEVIGQTVTWELRPDAVNDLVAVASARPDRQWFPLWMWPIVGATALTAIGLTLFVVRRRAAAPAAAAGGWTASVVPPDWPDPYQHPEAYDWHVESAPTGGANT